MSNRCQFTLSAATLFVAGVVVEWSLGTIGRVGGTQAEAQDKSSIQSEIEHGRYLVHHVAMCVECHTPRDTNGDLIETRILRGATIPVTGPRYAQPWAAHSASIAGLGNYDDAFVRCLLTQGERPDGSQPMSPMPTFGMSYEDANAVIAYLKSLSR